MCIPYDGFGGTGHPPAVPALVAVLRQLGELLKRLTDEQYIQKPVGVVPSSIGGHVRHNLDHVAALLAGLSGGAVNYDERQRCTDIERQRPAALAALVRLERELLGYPWEGAPDSLRLTTLLTADGEPVEVWSTLERELAFVLSHTIHHNSLIGVIAALLGVARPPRFGYAPSTIAYQEQTPCVR
jgi:uncharacterized damage-inducible protein DinB